MWRAARLPDGHRVGTVAPADVRAGPAGVLGGLGSGRALLHS